MMSEKTEITPFKMQILMEIAAKAVKMMVSGTWHLTFDEMDIVVEFIRKGIDESRGKNEKNEEEENVL